MPGVLAPSAPGLPRKRRQAQSVQAHAITRRPARPASPARAVCRAPPDVDKRSAAARSLDEDHPREHKVEEAERVDGQDLARRRQLCALEEVDARCRGRVGHEARATSARRHKGRETGSAERRGGRTPDGPADSEERDGRADVDRVEEERDDGREQQRRQAVAEHAQALEKGAARVERERERERSASALDEHGRLGRARATYTLPPSSLALMVTTVLPTVTSEMTIEKASMLCVAGACVRGERVQHGVHKRAARANEATHVDGEHDGQAEADDERAPEVPLAQEVLARRRCRAERRRRRPGRVQHLQQLGVDGLEVPQLARARSVGQAAGRVSSRSPGMP